MRHHVTAALLLLVIGGNGLAYIRDATEQEVRQHGPHCLFGVVSGGYDRCFWFAGDTAALNERLKMIAKARPEVQSSLARYTDRVVLHPGSKRDRDVDVDWTETRKSSSLGPGRRLLLEYRVDIWLVGTSA